MSRRAMLVGAGIGIGAIVVITAVLFSRDDGAGNVSDPQEMVERLEAAAISGCRSDQDQLVECVDAAGVAYFQAVLLGDDPLPADVIAEACDASAIVALYTEGQNWFGRVRAHPERAPDLATALGTTQVPCADVT